MSFYRSFCSIFQSWINGAVLSLNSYILRVECSYNGETKVYEIESKNLTGRESITFYAYQNSESFTIVWQKAVADYIKEI